MKTAYLQWITLPVSISCYCFVCTQANSGSKRDRKQPIKRSEFKMVLYKYIYNDFFARLKK
jgi:hypothetical protein